MKKLSAIIAAMALCLALAVTATGCTDFTAGQNLTIDKDAATPVFIEHPQSRLLRLGEATEALQVKAYSKDAGTLTYQWYSNAENSTEGGTPIEDATKSILSFETNAVGTTYYYCVVTNTNHHVAGKKTADAVSDIARVKIYTATETPRILSQPESFDYVIGAQEEALPLTVEAAVSKGTLSYQWFVSDTASYENAKALEGEINAQYIPEIGQMGEAYYYCEITNTDDTASEGNVAVVNSKLAHISVGYDYNGFTFEEIDDTTCKLTAYTGNSLKPVIPATDADGRAVVEIGAGVFANTSITEVTIPDTVKKLGQAAGSTYGDGNNGVFFNCKSLTSVHFDGQLTYIGEQTFRDCSSLTTDMWARCGDLEHLGIYAFNNATKMPFPENLVIPASLQGSLGVFIFENCTGIKNVTFAGEGITFVDGATFVGVKSLESIVFPASVTQVLDCLKWCDNLKSVTFERSLAKDGSITAGNPFNGTYSPDMVIYVPADSVDAYKASLGSFASQVKALAAESYTLTVTGATIDGENSLTLEAGTGLPAAVQVVYDDEAACLGWEYNGAYYADYAELAAGFKMGYANSTVRALYAEDFTETFTPSCSIKYRDTNEQFNGAMNHEEIDGIMGTRYVLSEKHDLAILNGTDEKHGSADGVDNACPVSAANKTCLWMTFKNNSSESITIEYAAEFFGKIGTVTVELGAGETKSALLVIDVAQESQNDCFHWLTVLSGGDNGYDITIVGQRVA